MITWVLYLCIGIVVGGMAGFYFAKLDDFSKKQKQELEDKLHKTEQELVEYKDQVTAHFIETANLINNMTESYQKVHEHLAKGSVQLCNNAVEVNKLTVSSDQLLAAKTAKKSNSDHAVGAAKVTNQTESSEAPKTNTVDNNNKSEVEAAVVPELAKTDSSEAAAADTHDDYHNIPTQPSFTPEEPRPAETTKIASSEPAGAAASVESPVFETMAVAEEEEQSKSSADDEPEGKIPGSRMVH